MSRAAAADAFAYIYEPDAIDVGILIFGKRGCSACDHDLPANTDYFAPDKWDAVGLVHECRRCRRAMERDRWARQREKEAISHGQLDFFAAAGA